MPTTNADLSKEGCSCQFLQAGLLTRGSQRISRLPGSLQTQWQLWEPLPTYSGRTVRDLHPVPFSPPL